MSDCRADDKYNIQFRLRRIEGKYELAGQFINAQQTTVVGASPLFMMMFLAVTNLVSTYQRYSEAHHIELLTDLTVASAPVVGALQRERGLSALTMASGFSQNNVDNLQRQRDELDQFINQFLTKTQNIAAEITFSKKIQQKIEAVQNNKLDEWRGKIDSRQMDRQQMVNLYTQAISSLLSVVDDVIAESSNSQITRELSTYSLIANTAEAAGKERASVAAYLASDKPIRKNWLNCKVCPTTACAIG